MKIKKVTIDDLEAYEISSSKVKMIVVTELGPRIAFFGKPNGDNLLYWQNNDIGREKWRLLGGHRVWVSRPLADEAEDAYASDNDPCSVTIKQNEFVATGGIHPVYKIQRGIQIKWLDDATFSITNFLTNKGPFLFSGGVWAATCIDPCRGKEFAVPLGDRSLSWDIIKIVIPRKFANHTAPVNDPQITFNDDFMIIRPQGIETKRMVMAPMGICAMTWPEKNISFVKYHPFDRNARYPQECNLAIYNAPENLMFEMESYGEEQTVIPGATIDNLEIWKLLDTKLEWEKPEHLVNLFK